MKIIPKLSQNTPTPLSVPLQLMELEEASDRKSEIWPHWMDVHSHLKDNFKVPFLV